MKLKPATTERKMADESRNFLSSQVFQLEDRIDTLQKKCQEFEEIIHEKDLTIFRLRADIKLEKFKK